MSGQMWDYPPNFTSSNAHRQWQAELNKHYTEMLNFTQFRGPWKPPTRWRRIKYRLKRPLWALQDWICDKICGCDR